MAMEMPEMPNPGFDATFERITLLEARLRLWLRRAVRICPAADPDYSPSSEDDQTKAKVKAHVTDDDDCDGQVCPGDWCCPAEYADWTCCDGDSDYICALDPSNC